MAYAGKKALIKVGGSPVAFTNQATTANAARTIYQITDASMQVWDRKATVTVQRSTDGGTTWTTLEPVTDGYSIQTLSGSIIFTNARATGTLIRVSGSYIPLSVAAECTEWKISKNANLLDVTKFQDDWISKIQGLKSAKGSLSRWLTVDTFFYDSLISGDPVVLELFAQDSLVPDRLWAILDSDQMEAKVASANNESVSFESDEEMLVG